MSCNFIIDTFAWIEYFKASKMGETAKQYVESERAVTPTIVVSEISRKLAKDIESGNETVEGRQKRLNFIKAMSRIVELDFDTAVKAGYTNLELGSQAKGWGLADSIIFCTAKKLNGKVVTGDQHFRNLPDVIFLKE